MLLYLMFCLRGNSCNLSKSCKQSHIIFVGLQANCHKSIRHVKKIIIIIIICLY